MAEITSMGVHTPTALPYLIAEGVLPVDPPAGLYQWKTYVVEDDQGDVEEEILATKSCVVWSQGRFVRNVYQFGLEGEDITDAVLTTFPASTVESGVTTVNTPGTLRAAPKTRIQRALVVILKSKAHIYFLQGGHHIVDLPFEAAKAFPCPRGILLQKRVAHSPVQSSTPQVPAAPPNSFLSNQIHPSSSYLQSPTLARSIAQSQSRPMRPSPLAGKDPLASLLHDVLDAPEQDPNDQVASLYTLTSPLSDLGTVANLTHQPASRLVGKGAANLVADAEPLDPNEALIYVSPQDEIVGSCAGLSQPLVLMVTANHELQMLTLWHAWYTVEKPLSALLKERAAQKAASARRRSSFLSATVGTGVTTPALRTREGARLSLLGQPKRDLAAGLAVTTGHRRTRQQEEDAMTVQMDPDYQPNASQQAARDTRRISSMNADIRQSHHNQLSGFVPAGSRRNASFGGANERRSFGLRRSRGSTPGSILSRGPEADDDSMDLDTSPPGEEEEMTEAAIEHLRATYRAMGAESVFGGAGVDFKRHMLVRKLHSMSWTSHSAPTPAIDEFQAHTLLSQLPRRGTDDYRLDVYVHTKSSKATVRLQLLVKIKLLWPEHENHPAIAIPTFVKDVNMGRCTSIAKLKDRDQRAMVLADMGILFDCDQEIPTRLPVQAPYAVYNPKDQTMLHLTLPRTVGRNRTLRSPSRDSLRICNVGSAGKYDEHASEGTFHRRRIMIGAKDRLVHQLLGSLTMVLPLQQARDLHGAWCTAYAALGTNAGVYADTLMNHEWLALASTIFLLVVDRIDQKAQAALQVSRVATGQSRTNDASRSRRRRDSLELPLGEGLSWMESYHDDKVHLQGGRRHSSAARADQSMIYATSLAIELGHSGELPQIAQLHDDDAVKILLNLHIVREEQKLSTSISHDKGNRFLAVIIAQLGSILGLPDWSYASGSYYELEGASEEAWAFVRSQPAQVPSMQCMDEPIGVFRWFEHVMLAGSQERYPTLDVIAVLGSTSSAGKRATTLLTSFTRRIKMMSDIVEATSGFVASSSSTVEIMSKCGLTVEALDTLPEALAAPLLEAITRCEQAPPTSWGPNLLALVGRQDLIASHSKTAADTAGIKSDAVKSDVETVCHAVDHDAANIRTQEADRHAVSQLIFREDRRLVEATSLMHFNATQLAECPKQPEWSDAQHLEHQRKVMQWVTTRMIALPAGDAMIHFDSQSPLLTDKYHLSGFSSSCLMQPMGHTMTTDRAGLTEEKVSWAYFHAGASRGLRISHRVTGIDTSWIAFNKPQDLTNRHAGLLLALGLNGHLKHVAKWLSFKYLTPKHSMTSVGLLLGLSASYLGTMDSLITRMLTVHITRMLPPGAAELNVSPVTQTAGLFGIGLLYCNTQHRRMSEVTLSEVEYMEPEDPDNGPDPLRDECYRLAAGFALGYINLGRGASMRGLHGMRLSERLLAVAVGPRPVSAVHVFDRATAGAIIAIALVYMKTGDESIATKVDIPDTEAQFDHVRPDMLMLRAMARHLIMWDTFEECEYDGFISRHMPTCYKERYRDMVAAKTKSQLESSAIPFFNVVTGVAWALSLRCAGSGSATARDEILSVLDMFHRIRSGAEAYYYDAKLARATVRRCIDVLALSAATVMAGTGDLTTFRYLRRLHGRTDPETPYGSHLAAHLAIGVLFLAGGTHTFGTSNLAIASLITAFYPLFPADVQDNHSHLQALRHFWVFAAEPRCLVVEEVDTGRPISMPIKITMKSGEIKHLIAPCLLPELDRISTVHTTDPAYWPVALDFRGNSDHLAAFRKDQTVLVRRCPASEAHDSSFSSTLATSNQAAASPLTSQDSLPWNNLFATLGLKALDGAKDALEPESVHDGIRTDDRDIRMALQRSATGYERDDLWNLRALFAWADKATEQNGGNLSWLGSEAVEELQALMDERMRQT